MKNEKNLKSRLNSQEKKSSNECAEMTNFGRGDASIANYFINKVSRRIKRMNEKQRTVQNKTTNRMRYDSRWGKKSRCIRIAQRSRVLPNNPCKLRVEVCVDEDPGMSLQNCSLLAKQVTATGVLRCRQATMRQTKREREKTTCKQSWTCQTH